MNWSLRLLCPQDCPGMNARVGCHFLLQGVFPTQGWKLHLLSLLFDRWFFYHCATWEVHMVSLHEYIFKRCHPNPQDKSSCSRPKIKSVVNKSSPTFSLPIWCQFLSWSLRLWSQPGQEGGLGTVLILLWVWVWPVSVLGQTGALFLQPLQPGPCCCHVPPCSAMENGREVPDTKVIPTTSASGATTWAGGGWTPHFLRLPTWWPPSLQVPVWKGGSGSLWPLALFCLIIVKGSSSWNL